VKAEGLYPMKATSLLCFFRLKGCTSIINLDNTEPLLPLQYLLHSPKENKFYLKDYKGYEIKELFDLVYRGDDPFINNLVQWVADGNIYLLFTKSMVDDMTKMLTRIWDARFSSKGKMEYNDFLRLLKAYVDLEEYKGFGKELTGFRTVCKQYDDTIAVIWDEIYKKIKK
jgi:hypothetical protein